MILSDISASLSGLLCLCQHVRPTSFFFFSWQYCSVLFTGCVISVFCLCLQGWPMNRQLCKGPQIFHRPVSESRAYLPTGQVLPLFCPDQLSPGVSGASFLQNSVTHHYLTVFGTFASSQQLYIWPHVFILFVVVVLFFSTSLKNQK